jgi:hypothetical protein
MKVVIVSVPMMAKKDRRGNDILKRLVYPVDGNKAIEYDKPVCCPVNAVLAKTLKKGEEVKVIYLMTVGENSRCEENKPTFIEELEGINAGIGAVISYDTVEMEFRATKHTHNKLILDIAEKIPEKAEIFADITYGFNTEILSLVCALRFFEEFRDADIEYIIYGKLETNQETREKENPMIFDITSTYYLFKLIGSIGAADFDTASKKLKDFFDL